MDKFCDDKGMSKEEFVKVFQTCRQCSFEVAENYIEKWYTK